jgi:hypothetical protein
LSLVIPAEPVQRREHLSSGEKMELDPEEFTFKRKRRPSGRSSEPTTPHPRLRNTHTLASARGMHRRAVEIEQQSCSADRVGANSDTIPMLGKIWNGATWGHVS